MRVHNLIIFSSTNYNGVRHFCHKNVYSPKCSQQYSKDLKLLIYHKKSAFHSNDTTNLRTINEQLKKAIESQKKIYKQKIEDHLKSNDSQKAWDDLKTITGYKKKLNLPNVENNKTFANELNEFYSRFYTHDFPDECHKVLQQLDIHIQNDESPEVTVPHVNNALPKIKIRKAPGPDPWILPKLN